MTLYIEQIPRNNDAPYWTTEETDIQKIQQWILENCNIRKRHVISSKRMGPVKAEGVNITRFYGFNSYNKKPLSIKLDRLKDSHHGYKLFENESEALAHYYNCKAIADKKLAIDSEEAGKMLLDLKAKGVNFDSWASAADDYNLDHGFCVSCEIDGFYFSLRV